MGLISLLLMVVGWLLIIVAAFGSGLNIHVGQLTGFDSGAVLVLLALCLGTGPALASAYWPRPAA